ncbi:uncharacterized protein BKCO1_60004 [Diplodia corticola]|uniref:F-box domain-containing protein n=1 Tax=Diplodia corticola TaxID=236234 RepID=A0A1J9RAV9_9PEZI|nr:uncharacterized protein BKCO1_60004 [Diplodia corticola]OJD37688.1 hypothetical protein BKCO1_60004 [Diplodia corticola]
MATAYEQCIAAKPKAFQILPVELNQQIAFYIEYDKDLANLRASCRAIRDAIDDGDSLWFKRFHALYDPPSGFETSSPGYKALLRELYQKRARLLFHPTRFRIGNTKKEKETLRLVAGLLNDSYNGPSTVRRVYDSGESKITCHNIEVFKTFVGRSGLIEHLFRPRPTRNHKANGNCDPATNKYSHALAAVQLMCAPTILKHPGNIYGFEDSQVWAYATIKTAPIFGGYNKTMINMEWVLHVMNFFKFHIGKSDENTLFDPFNSLAASEKPSYWQGPLHNGPANLGVHWKGTYSYLDREEMKQIRSGIRQERVLIDRNVDHGEAAIQTMNITFPDSTNFHWPDVFEHHLKSITSNDQPPRTRAQRRSGEDFQFQRFNQRFQAVGYDDEDFDAAGWLNELPNQHGISGWKRMTMMKYFEDGNGGWDSNALWAYEGVVLPGGRIMLGRWWSPESPVPNREVYTGPFIFWNTDAACDRIGCDFHHP